jgi:methionine-rich copper-binding protein CopC
MTWANRFFYNGFYCMRWTLRTTLKQAVTGLALAWSGACFAHAFPQQEDPGAGAVLYESPAQVMIRFDAKIEPVFSTLEVKDGQGNIVSGESKIGNDSQTIEAGLHALPPGEYHVYWKVVAWDGHHTGGDYVFTVAP